MQYHSLKKVFWFMLLLVCTACPVPDIDEYSDLTREMAEAVKTSANEIIYFLEEGLSSNTDEAPEIDPMLLEDLAAIQGQIPEFQAVDYPEELKRQWNTVFRTLNALVAYSDALAGIQASGAKGKESFSRVSDALNNVLSVTGIAIPGKLSKVGEYIYGQVAQIKSKNKLEDVISNADTAIQHIALKLDTALYNMKTINDVAKSQMLLKMSDSKEAQQIKKLYESLVKKESRNMVKVSLLNEYENGDYEALKFFVYEDPLTLDKLGIKSLTEQIAGINTANGLTPRDRLEQISALATTTFKEAIDNKLQNHHIVNAIDLNERRVYIQQELRFIREELNAIAPKYHKNIADQQQIEKTAKINEKLITSSGKLIKSWSKYHGQMNEFLTKKQKLSLNELKLYINEIKALKAALQKQN